MKKNTVYRYLYFLILTVCFSTSTSCSQEESTNLVIIAGLHSNSQRINISIKDEIEKIYENFGEIGVIVVDGTPTIIQKEEGILGYYNNEFISKSKKAKKIIKNTGNKIICKNK